MSPNRIPPPHDEDDDFIFDQNGGEDEEEGIFIGMNYVKSKGPGAKNDTTESPGCFNQILTFESRKWSPVATF